MHESGPGKELEGVKTAEVPFSIGAVGDFQSIRILEKVGGNVDILLGINYIAFFPVLVHMLASCLGIHKLKMKSIGNKFTCVIAGPHSSFDKILQEVGNAAYLLLMFTEGLPTW